MADKAIHEMISSFAAGCMDKQNFEQFKEYLREEGELPAGELGELQNVISLLPIILDIEKPDPKLKDKLGKKLISLQSEIKKKIKATKQSTEHTSPVEPDKQEAVVDEVEKNIEEEEQFISGEEHHASNMQPAMPAGQNFYRNKGGNVKSLAPVWIALVVTLIVLLAAVGFLYFSNAAYQEKTTTLENRIDTLEGQLNYVNGFVNEYKALIEFVNYGDTQIISLSPMENSSSSYGRLFLSFGHRRGMLELANMPALNSDQAFQVWLVDEGKSFSIGTYIPRRDTKYIEISNIPSIPENRVDLVRVTVEPGAGSEVPTGQVVLYGSSSQASAETK